MHLSDIHNIIKGTVLSNELMSKHTSYGIGGKVLAYIRPYDRHELIKIIKLINENNSKLYFVGSGSNLLVNDKKINAYIITPSKALKSFSIENNVIMAESGVMLGKIVKEAIKHNLTGLESLVGVPGTLGGALMMNAGAWGAEISPDYHQRSRIVSGREAFTLIGLLISALIPLGVEVSGEGVSLKEGLNRTLAAIFLFKDFSTSNQMRDILGYMGLGIILLLPIFAAIALWKVPDPMPEVKKKIPLKEGLKYAKENPLLVRILAIIFLVIAGESFRNTLSLWFVRDVIGIETVGASYARYFIAGFLAIPFWLWLGKVIGKHRAFCITLVGTGTVSFLCFFLERGDFTQFHILFLVKGFCFGGLQFLPASMLADVVDLDSLKTGGRRAGTFFALNGMIAKVSAMIAVWAAAILVDFSGFVPGTLNSESAMLALRVYYCLGCAAFFLPALFLTWFYPLTKEKHKELREELESQSN